MDSVYFMADNVTGGYGAMQVLWNVTLQAYPGERILLLGANGAGKTTFLKILSGVLPLTGGHIQFRGDSLDTLRMDARIRKGIAYMSELGVVPSLTVEENMRLGAYYLPRRDVRMLLEEMYQRFPDLKQKRKLLGGSLSGGQRKMLGIAKALMSRPSVLLLDEPSAGLSPKYVQDVIQILQQFQSETLTLIIAEQNIRFLDIADRVYVMDGGKISFSGTIAELQANDAVRSAYFGLTSH